eukprot:CAMPEP_0202967158 /NCGR_PEP_ID=MMETSP1396-20130829/11943_1 /ASSEMBLY_ACC=CAM_ASM_000872 /TAXON_ID= /ORGANISM="Pseudokeronopsis sp., Strain Brazil" /LENGTH=55 /DNA_ID=CAMNT_0049691903 /DNA_START=108 /DNA_END=271 /DNA_ORIENTATION=+
MRTIPGKNYIVPESKEDIIEYLDNKKPTYTLIYFTASWNPIIKQVEKDYENTTNA